MKKTFKDHDLVKIIGLIILFTAILTWIIPTGSFESGFQSIGIKRIGIIDFFSAGLTGINWFLYQVVFLLVLGGFYGFLTKVKGYQALVSKLAKSIKGKEITFVLLVSFLLAILASISTSIFQLLVFVPFLVTVILKAKMDKITAFSATFGAILIGVIGATYSGAGLNFISYYMGLETEAMMIAKVGIFFGTYALFNFFTIKHLKETLSNKKAEVEEDKFEVSDAKASTMPILIVFGLMTVLMLIGYIDWVSNFKIEIFANFHEWLTKLTIGEHTIFQYLIATPDSQTGVIAGEIGTWDMLIATIVLIKAIIVLALIYKVKCSEVLSSIGEGMKKMLKPILVFILINMIFVLIVWSPFVPTIVNWILGITKSFNVYLTSLVGLIAGIFNIDVGYTGYLFGPYLAETYGNHKEVIMLVLNSMYGLVQFIAPTSIILMLGLAYLDVEYKKWFKHIWKFLVAIFVLLLIVFTILTYVI